MFLIRLVSLSPSDIATIALAIAAVATLLLKLYDRQQKRNKEVEFQHKEKPKTLEIPEWIETGYPSIALIMKSFPDGWIVDRHVYDELGRRLSVALNSWGQRESWHTELGEPPQILEGIDRTYSATDAVNYANAQLTARTSFPKRWWK